MKIKRTLILIIIFIFVLPVISSCGIDKNNPNNPNNQNNQNSSEAQTTIDIIEYDDFQMKYTEPGTQEKNNEQDLSDSDLSDSDIIEIKGVETVLRWYTYNFNADKIFNGKVPTIAWFDSEDEMVSFIDEYLQGNKMFKETPDSIFYGGDNYFAEYYTDSEKRKSSFIIHLSEPVIYYDDDGHENHENYEETAVFDWHICCITISWDDLQELGVMLYECNKNGDTLREDLYNPQGELITSMSYEYFKGVPFAFMNIKGNKFFGRTGLDMYWSSPETIINRSQKFCFYKDFAVFDETGAVTGYNRDLSLDADNLTDYSNQFIYDEKGRLTAIYDELTFSSEITLEYRDNDKLKELNYNFFGDNHGTADQSGKIYYDELGRITYRSYYMTHGDHTCIYLYAGESKRPWACIEWCGMSQSGIDNIDYNNGLSIYLFMNQ